jgi:hypothetical protein
LLRKVEEGRSQRPAEKKLGAEEIGDREVAGDQPALGQAPALDQKSQEGQGEGRTGQPEGGPPQLQQVEEGRQQIAGKGTPEKDVGKVGQRG